MSRTFRFVKKNVQIIWIYHLSLLKINPILLARRSPYSVVVVLIMAGELLKQSCWPRHTTQFHWTTVNESFVSLVCDE